MAASCRPSSASLASELRSSNAVISSVRFSSAFEVIDERSSSAFEISVVVRLTSERRCSISAAAWLGEWGSFIVVVVLAAFGPEMRWPPASL